MLHDEIFEIIKAELAEEFEIPAEEISPESNLWTDLELDSLDAIDILVYLEKKFEIKVPPAETKTLKTVEDVIILVDKLKQ